MAIFHIPDTRSILQMAHHLQLLAWRQGRP
jgi:hypothetical protein